MSFSEQPNSEVERLIEEQRTADAHEWNDFVMKALFAHFSKLEQAYSQFYATAAQLEGFDPATAQSSLQEVGSALVAAGEVVLRFCPERATGTPEQVFRASRAACVSSPENDLALFDAQWDIVRSSLAYFKERSAALEKLLSEHRAAQQSSQQPATAQSNLPPLPGTAPPPPPPPPAQG